MYGGMYSIVSGLWPQPKREITVDAHAKPMQDARTGYSCMRSSVLVTKGFFCSPTPESNLDAAEDLGE